MRVFDLRVIEMFFDTLFNFDKFYCSIDIVRHIEILLKCSKNTLRCVLFLHIFYYYIFFIYRRLAQKLMCLCQLCLKIIFAEVKACVILTSYINWVAKLFPSFGALYVIFWVIFRILYVSIRLPRRCLSFSFVLWGVKRGNCPDTTYCVENVAS